MKITNIRKLKISATPYPKVNEHLVSVRDEDVGEYIARINVPTGKIRFYCLMYMEVQTSGTLRIGETFTFGNIWFEVTGMTEGWYQVSTSEHPVKNIEIWNDMEIEIKKIHCK